MNVVHDPRMCQQYVASTQPEQSIVPEPSSSEEPSRDGITNTIKTVLAESGGFGNRKAVTFDGRVKILTQYVRALLEQGQDPKAIMKLFAGHRELGYKVLSGLHLDTQTFQQVKQQFDTCVEAFENIEKIKHYEHYSSIGSEERDNIAKDYKYANELAGNRHLSVNDNRNRDLSSLELQDLKQRYLSNLRSSSFMGDHELGPLAHMLQQPIVVIQTAKEKNRFGKSVKVEKVTQVYGQRYSGNPKSKPITIYHNGSNHYEPWKPSVPQDRYRSGDSCVGSTLRSSEPIGGVNNCLLNALVADPRARQIIEQLDENTDGKNVRGLLADWQTNVDVDFYAQGR